MTSKSFSQWIKEQRVRKKLSIKQFEKEFNRFKKASRVWNAKGSGNRTYQWFTGFEKYGEWASRELEMLSAMAQFFGYRITVLPDKDVSSLTDKEKQEVQQLIEVEKQQEEKDDEHFTQKSIADKNW